MVNDAIQILEQQHNEVRAALDRLAAGGRGGDALSVTAEALRLHAQLEEELIYPMLAGLGDAATEIETAASVEKHRLVDLMLDRLADGGDDVQFRGRVAVLRELVESHIGEEEAAVFPLLGQLGGEELRRLGAELHERTEELRTRRLKAA